MNSELQTLREKIIATVVPEFPDFEFQLEESTDGNLAVEYRPTWEPVREKSAYPFMTIHHDTEKYIATHHGWNDYKRYKTLKGVLHYVTEELTDGCRRRREHKAKMDAEKEFARKSEEMLRDYHAKLTEIGIPARLFLDSHQGKHICVETKRINGSVDVSVSHDYRFELVFSYPRCYIHPDTALEILSVLSVKDAK